MAVQHVQTGSELAEVCPGYFRCSIQQTQDPVTSLITSRRLRLCVHISRADPSQDHQRALRAAINRFPADWQRPRGRPRRTWLRIPSNSTSNRTTWATTRRGRGHRTVQNGVNLWRRLCSLKGAPPNDDDDDDDTANCCNSPAKADDGSGMQSS